MEPGRCPVCQARFREGWSCSRCGADLVPLLTLAARAFRLRQAAREAVAAGHDQEALDLAARAQTLQRTAPGRALVFLASLCLAVQPTTAADTAT